MDDRLDAIGEAAKVSALLGCQFRHVKSLVNHAAE
jgi:hypothetical protein